jgi:hypothetical protein
VCKKDRESQDWDSLMYESRIMENEGINEKNKICHTRQTKGWEDEKLNWQEVVTEEEEDEQN